MKTMKAKKSIQELRKFGLTMFGILAVIAALLLWKSKNSWQILALLSALFLFSSIFFPQSLRPIEKWWLVFGEKMSTVISFIILFITFYLAITPMAYIMKLFGKDPLSRKLDKNLNSYWTPSDSQGTGSRHFLPY